MKIIELEVDRFTSFEFNPFREYEGHSFWSLAKRKRGKFGKGNQITVTNTEEQKVFIEILQAIINMVESEEAIDNYPEKEEEYDDVPF